MRTNLNICLKISFLFFVIIFAILIFTPLGKSLTCTFSTSCAYTTVYKLSALTNAHAEAYNQANYPYHVCCYDDFPLNNSCIDSVILHLSSLTNAHAEKATQNFYGVNVCLTADDPNENITCTYRTTDCLASEACLGTISTGIRGADTNLHVADCTTDPYETRICCRSVKPDLTVNQSSIQPDIAVPNEGDLVTFDITVWNIGDHAAVNVNVSCYANGTYFDSYIINSIPPDPSQQTPRYATCTWTAQPSYWNISVYVDPLDEISEYNETNNEAWKLIYVDYNPVVSKPYFNVTPAEIIRGDGIEISCDVTDVEDTSAQLTVNISVRDASGIWSNVTVATYIGNTFYREYGTTSSSPLGTYTAVCTAVDTNGGRTEGPTNTFLVFQNGTVTINLNATVVWWGEGVEVWGQAYYVDTNNPINLSAVAVKINGKTMCTDTTDINGLYGCSFEAPKNVGDYTLKVEVTDKDTGKVIYNTTAFYVRLIYGGTEREREEAENVACYQVPRLIQNPDGTIEKVMVTVCVWK
jgi:hypothetical protein